MGQQKWSSGDQDMIYRRRPLYLFAALTMATVLAGSALAQDHPPAIRVGIGWGVDTVATPNHEIFALWRTYLRSRPDSIRPTELWSRAEQRRWPQFDLLAPYVYQGFTRFTVLHLAPAVGSDSTYLIRTLVYRDADSLGPVKPLALYRVYAIREEGRWVLANALPRLTRGWRHERIGHVTFVFPSTHTFARARAEASAGFMDSLARAFQVSPPQDIEYYFTDDLSDTFRAAGLDFFPVGPDTAGGRALVADNLVLVGSSTGGEDYRHELAHVVLQSLVGPRTARLVAEGLMTWTGGSAGLRFRDLMPALNRYLENHPALTLRQLIEDPPERTGTLDAGYDGFAVLCEMIYRAAGISGIRELAAAGRDPASVTATAARLLGIPVTRLDPLWRQRIGRLAEQ